MTVSTLTDSLRDALTLAQAAHLLSPVPHVATLHRWATRGTRGVRLATWLRGGVRVTTPAAVEEFLRGLSASVMTALLVPSFDRHVVRRRACSVL